MGKDTLSDLLRSVRLKGALFFHVECTDPWVTEAPAASAIAPAVLPASEHVMEYHVVLEGGCWAGLIGEQQIRLEQGDIFVLPHGDAHVLSSKAGMRASAAMDFLFTRDRPQLPFLLQQGGAAGGAQTTLLCGFLGCDRRPFNPLLASLPRMIHAPASALDPAVDQWIVHFARMAASESRSKRPGGEAVLERMSEMMFVELLRGYLEKLPDDQHGWLAGLRDRYVGRVLGLMHESPGEPWTVERLAEKVGLSRSALHERFIQFIGLPPMQYLIKWRMQIASQLLSQSNAPLASIALDAGYESEAAFSRAFKRAAGVPPSVWRRERAASGARTQERPAVQA